MNKTDLEILFEVSYATGRDGLGSLTLSDLYGRILAERRSIGWPEFPAQEFDHRTTDLWNDGYISLNPVRLTPKGEKAVAPSWLERLLERLM